jgi:ABC-type amino acid transport substrate-binding protein
LDVLLTCKGQLRLAPSGQVIGIDMDAVLALAEARGHDLWVLSELLPASEAGLIDALSTDRAPG